MCCSSNVVEGVVVVVVVVVEEVVVVVVVVVVAVVVLSVIHVVQELTAKVAQRSNAPIVQALFLVCLQVEPGDRTCTP